MSPSRLAAWLSRVPASAARLELRYDSLGGPIALAGYARTDVDGTAAEVLLETAQDHCETVRLRCSFQIVWLDAEGRALATKPVRCEPEDSLAEPRLAGAGDAPKETATMDGLVGQLMRHVENRERMLNLALGTNLKMMHDQLRDARAEADSLRAELRVARQRAKEVEAGETTDAETEARSEAIAKVADAVVTHLVPLAAARLREGLQ